MSRRMTRTGALISLWALIWLWPAGCVGPLPPLGLPEPGTYRRIVRFKDQGPRDFLVHLPKGYVASKAYPLVVMLHGALSTAGRAERLTGLSRLADRAGFIAVYPNGIGVFGLFQHWNAGHCCGRAMKDKLDDVGFVAEVIGWVKGRHRIDGGRVYLVGYSNGGMLAYRFAAERPGLVAAVAVVAGSVGSRPAGGGAEWRLPKPLKVMPVIAFHGRRDSSVPFEGGRSGTGLPRAFVSALDSARFWAKNNGCKRPPKVERLQDNRIRRRSWCRGGPGEVVLYGLDDWGHEWPSRRTTARRTAHGKPRGFDAARIIWQFVSRHRR